MRIFHHSPALRFGRFKLNYVSPILFLLGIVAATGYRYRSTHQPRRVHNVIVYSRWQILAEKSQLAKFAATDPDLPPYQLPSKAPDKVDIYHPHGDGCEFFFREVDPNRLLIFYWNDLSIAERESMANRLGYSPGISFNQLLKGPFPSRPWAYKHGYIPTSTERFKLTPIPTHRPNEVILARRS